MKIWAIADLHLSFGVPEKTMEVFGPEWKSYAEKIQKHWVDQIGQEDLVLVAGDVSWAMALKDAKVDLEWIDRLPGTKVLIKGNHDYWWSSLSKVKSILPASLHVIQNNSFNYKGISVGGARLWDTDEFNFNEYIEFKETAISSSKENEFNQEKIFKRELERLELSLKQLDQEADLRIAMTHYPPIGADLKPSKASEILEKYHIDLCVFGHLHNVKRGVKLFGKNAIAYYLTSCDYLDFKPLLLI